MAAQEVTSGAPSNQQNVPGKDEKAGEQGKSVVPVETPQAPVDKSAVSVEPAQAAAEKSAVPVEPPQAPAGKSVVIVEPPQALAEPGSAQEPGDLVPSAGPGEVGAIEAPPVEDATKEPRTIAWMRKMFAMINAEQAWNDAHLQPVIKFLHATDAGRLFVYWDKLGHLVCTADSPPHWDEVLVFLRDPSEVVNDENIDKVVQCEVLRSSPGHSLLRLMQTIYLPAMLENESWQASVTKDFKAGLDKFLASLTESIFEAEGKTVLYIPPVSLIGTMGAQTRDKDLTQRVESVVIRWTRQIKEVVRNQERLSESEPTGLLAEVEFWRGRSADLCGIRDQINSAGVADLLTILDRMKSTYLEPFLNLSKRIEQEAVIAEENLKFLVYLEEPCTELLSSEIRDLPSVLPKLLFRIRMIWKLSSYFNPPEKVTGLLCKVSNEIINHCIQGIPLTEMFEGIVDRCRAALQESIQACEAWRRLYAEMMRTSADMTLSIRGSTVEAGRSGHTVPLMVDKGLAEWGSKSVFAPVEAFMQRCANMLEVCDGQSQYSLKVALPAFGGTRGPEIMKSLLELKEAFQKLVNKLRSLSYNLLDVKMTRWHDDFHEYKEHVKDLEVMTQNVMFMAFRHAASLVESIELLEAFKLMACRQPIVDCVEQMTSQVCTAFSSELNILKKQFDQLRRRPLLDYSFPRYAGSAMWALHFKSRLNRPMLLLTNAAPYLLESTEASELKIQYSQIISSIDQFIQSQHLEWTSHIDLHSRKKLEKSLLDAAGDGFVVRFDPSLQTLFFEVHYWKNLGWDIALAAVDALDGYEVLRVLKEDVVVVIREQNKLVASLETEMRGLVADRVNQLESCVHPGLDRLNWLSDGAELAQYLRLVRLNCFILEETVAHITLAGKKITSLCEQIGECWLISLQRRRIYDLSEFDKKQEEHGAAMRKRLEKAYVTIKDFIDTAYSKCPSELEEVHNKWEEYRKQVEDKLEAALRNAVVRSLEVLTHAVNSESKSVYPLFNTVALLDKASGHVQLTPNVQEILGVVQFVGRELVTVISVVPRLRKESPSAADIEVHEEHGQAPVLTGFHPNRMPNFYEAIAVDQETTHMMITQGVLGIADRIQQFLQYWEKKYKSVWDQDKEAYIRRYEKAKKPLSAFESDILKYRDLQDDVHAEESITNLRFLRVDCGPLKQAVIAHCEGWILKFTTLLNAVAKAELDSINAYLAKHTEELNIPPENLDMLTDTNKKWELVVSECLVTQARFEPLQEKYKALAKFEVSVAEEEKQQLENLPKQWEAFQQMLKEVEKKLEESKQQFQDTLTKLVEAFTAEMVETRARFVERMPMTNATSVSEALKFIEEEAAKIEAFQRRGADVWAGMSLFGMEKLMYKENAQTLKDLEILKNMWNVKKEWNEAFDSWKDGLFRDLDVASMEASAAQFSKRVFKIGRDTKTWPVWGDLKESIDAFKATLPLTVDLRNPAMRERHWKQLQEQVGHVFDPTSNTFTLAKVAELRLDLHVAAICDLSVAASKELAIEDALNKIKENWKSLDLDMVPEKQVYKIRGTEDIFVVLEDNRVVLSSMKSNRFHIHFASDINIWEKKLSLVSETIEMITQVQRTWSYLENIFVGSEDIRKQLVAETASFDAVNDVFSKYMRQVYEIRNALRAMEIPNLLQIFIDMDKKLEKIQKSLEDYLEQKRQQFPRFYFLSSENLLEILGQAKDPRNVQPHLKKCFEGIKKLEMFSPGSEGRKHYEATGIFSPDGEYMPFQLTQVLDTRPEEWLNKIEIAMRATLKVHLIKALEESKQAKKDKWIKENAGQCVISAGQVKWTAECEKALNGTDTSKAACKKVFRKWISYLNKLTDMTRTKLSKIDRNKTTALITIEVHSRDVIEKLIKVGCSAATDFEWSSQLRFYWEKEDCLIKQVLSVFGYGYEYQGNNGRLVITPLTDRCYITLGAALFTRRGGNPLGPAGTGKTETVKDFGKALARYVIVFNCSDGVDYKMTGKMFSGLAQTGAWACLDEFNRIEVEVLSVVASQIHAVMAGIKAGLDRFVFEGVEIRLIRTCGIFVTMNPGYAGRSELPENLKAMLRPVSMMLPDFSLIGENMLFSEGFQTAKVLAKKLIAVMELSQRQLSKQDHYDYGLRSFIIPIARMAGSVKRVDPDILEEVILQRSMRDLIMPKLVFQDIPLFNALLSDLFPGLELAPKEAETLKGALRHVLTEHGLQVVDAFVIKCIQVYDCMVARHGNMLVGKTGSGKTEAWKALSRAQGYLKDQQVEEWEHVHVHIMNSLALSNDEIYGAYSKLTAEWVDGILSHIMRIVCSDEGLDCKWILFDGPVDTLWIESMNTLLDDNKILTLLNGERISMPLQVSLLFEVEDLSQASPATVSRAGMIYLNVEELGWWPYVESWIQRKVASGVDAVLLRELRKLLQRYVDAAALVRRTKCKEVVPIDHLNSVITFTKLFDSLATAENGVHPSEGDNYIPMIETWFLFCLTWSIGASVDEEGRKVFDIFIRDYDSRYPVTGTVFDYFVDVKKKVFASWEEKLPSNFKIPVGAPFHKIQVPTVDSIRTNFVVKTIVLANRHSLIVGKVGVGKTLIANSILSSLPEGLSTMTINFSAQTSSNSLQETIEGRLEKRTKGVFAPPGGKKLLVFLDDLNMPKKSQFGFMPALELLKLWMDNGFWYDRLKQETKQVKNMQFLSAMAPPGGGRNVISRRIQACFSLVNITPPNDQQMKRIFGAILTAKLADFENEVRMLGETLVSFSIEVYNVVIAELLPIPSKSHYLFNMRDLAKVIQGMLQASKDIYTTKDMMYSLFCHECFRVYGDRMWDKQDKLWLQNLLTTKLKENFDVEWRALFGSEMPMFTSVLQSSMEEHPLYERNPGFPLMKEALEENLKECKMQPGMFGMDLVLFKDAIEHICRIHRVLLQPRGNLLLVGIGGSGRKSLTKLSCFVADMKVFSIMITKNYLSAQFHDDLKILFQQAGIGENLRPTVFMFDDTQVVQETFLEDINNILSSGEVPNLFNKDDLSVIYEGVRAACKKAGKGETDDELFAFFIERAKENLHVVLCLSPVQAAFHKRLQMFPGLVNCTTIDWFLDWPEDALYEVSVKLLADEETLPTPEMRLSVCKVFVTIHKSVVVQSQKMLERLKRQYYVTPTSYLEFAKGYKKLMREKKQQLSDNASKLRGGLSALNSTRDQVAALQVICQQKKEVVAKAKRECEELLVEIVQEKRAVDEQERQVNAEAAKIEKEAEKCNVIAAECKKELDKAMPALLAAEEALNVLTKKDMSEVKAYAKPPALVELTLGAVMTVLKKPPTWAQAKLELGDSQFLQKLMDYDKDLLVDALLKKMNKYTTDPEFTPDIIGKVSSAARGLCLWVRAMETYGYIAKEVAPKKQRLKAAQDNLAKQEAALQDARSKLEEVRLKVATLKEKYEKSIASKEALQTELDDLEVKLFRAEKLVSGLAGEKQRWELSIASLEEGVKKLPGDCLLAAAFLSYVGPFVSEFRDELITLWLPEVVKLGIPSSPSFAFANFLADAGDVREWNLQGLPADSFSTENGVMVTRSNRWPLMIDPQEQAKKWVKNYEAPNGLEVVDLQADNLMRVMEHAIQLGNPVLLVDILQEIDPALEPVLSKSFIRRGKGVFIRLGDKEVDYNSSFRLYITTKLANPNFSPEISTKATIINFAVKEESLEAQLLTLVVQKERPDLDKQRNELIVTVSQGKKTQTRCEDDILRMLATAEGPILENIELIATLDKSKETWETVKASIEIAEDTAKKIDVASASYKPCAERASLLYFILIELVAIDPMYQFSLQAYTELFLISIAKSPTSENLNERIKGLVEYHTYAVYKYTTRGLFEKHKLLLSLQIAAKVLLASNQITNDEWQYFLRGGTVLDRTNQIPNPSPEWITELAWDNVAELIKALPAQFDGFVQSLTTDNLKWKQWFDHPEPEAIELPGDWEDKCSDLQHMIILRCFRMDRVIFAITAYVSNILGQKFVEPPILDLTEAFGDSGPTSPLMFILSAGVDPTAGLMQFAAQNAMSDRFHAIALGQGQGPVAVKLITEASQSGGWVFLANCHLMTKWLPSLEKLIQTVEKSKPNELFRLWLSSVPHEDFPIAILQRSVKLTAEPPKGLRSNLMRLYNQATEEGFLQCKAQEKYQKLYFALAYFHSVMLERRKFGTLGLNIPYDFNDTDFQVSDDLLKTYLDNYEETPFEALKFLISQANYGGRVTDELDRRVLASYLNQFYCPEILSTPNFELSSLPEYHVPDDGTLESHREFIAGLPGVDRPEAFGQHANADIAFQLSDSRLILETITGLQPKVTTSKGGKSREDTVMDITSDLLTQVPEPFDLVEIQKFKSLDPSALHTLLFQEIERYNILLVNIRDNCEKLQKGIQGLVVMSPELTTIFNSLADAKVPPIWVKAYPSIKPLGPWTRDLMQRLTEIKTWAEGIYPTVYWLAGFTYPADFLTAVLQTTARKNLIPIDTLVWEFTVINKDEADITEGPKEGIYVKGLYLEGAGWDHQNECLTEPKPMDLIVPMPIMHFKPIRNRNKTPKGVYNCPLFLYPIRTGPRERPSWILTVTLRTGGSNPDHWVKRGTALLLSLAT